MKIALALFASALLAQGTSTGSSSTGSSVATPADSTTADTGADGGTAMDTVSATHKKKGKKKKPRGAADGGVRSTAPKPESGAEPSK
jgi:hypothetical protein